MVAEFHTSSEILTSSRIWQYRKVINFTKVRGIKSGFMSHLETHRDDTLVLTLVRVMISHVAHYPGWNTNCNSDSTLKQKPHPELSVMPFLCSPLLPVMMQSPKLCKHSKSIHISEITSTTHICMGSSINWELFKNRFQEQQVNLPQLVLNIDKRLTTRKKGF